MFYAKIIGGIILIAVLVSGGLYIRSLRAEAKLLESQKQQAIDANKSLTDTLQATTRANEYAAKINEQLEERLRERTSISNEVKRAIGNATQANTACDQYGVQPLVRDVLDRMWYPRPGDKGREGPTTRPNNPSKVR